MNIENAIVVLKALAIGMHIDIGDHRYKMAMGEDGSIGWLYNEDRVVSELTTGAFIRICEAMTDSQIRLIQSNYVLNTYKER